jgi:hypothetical protein
VTATNHALTGALIGLTISNPFIAIPAALLSHFVCDAIPHFGMGEGFMKTKVFRRMLIIEALLCVLLVVFLAGTAPAHWPLAAVCAFVATSPDFLWIPLYCQTLRGKQFVFTGFYKFASDIQWFEKPIGGVVELVWFIGGIFLLASIVLG